MPKRRPSLETATLERAAANLRKATQLFEMREYSMTVVRATTVVEVCHDGILHDRMTRIFRDRRLVGTILRRLAPDEKYTWLMKELFGFSLSEPCPEAVRGLPDIRQERNDVVHRGTFSRKATAERAMNLAVSIVREVRGALKIKRG